MRSRQEYEEVMCLISGGMNDSAIARQTGIPRSTVREWRKGVVPAARRTGHHFDRTRCGAVEHATDFGDVYAYLLGQYLGDGMLSRYPRDVYRLRIACTEAYPDVLDEVAGSIMTIRGSETVGLATRVGDVEVSSYWKHWVCVFPQHGAGPKWQRSIRLEDWQAAIVDRHPWQLLRGLIHSDGCRHINTVRRQVGGQVKTYRYSRYAFTNASSDILELFGTTCTSVGLHWTRTGQRTIAISRRPDVERMDRFIGPKS